MSTDTLQLDSRELARAYKAPDGARQGQLTTWVAVREFLYAGNATFTLRSLKTGMRYTYKVRVKKEDLDTPDPTYFVNLLRGADNTKDFAYMGVLRNTGQFNFTSASRMTRGAPAAKALLWFLDAMRCERDVLGQTLEVWHEGRCGCCGRLLTVPESVLKGLGPECAGKRMA